MTSKCFVVNMPSLIGAVLLTSQQNIIGRLAFNVWVP